MSTQVFLWLFQNCFLTVPVDGPNARFVKPSKCWILISSSMHPSRYYRPVLSSHSSSGVSFCKLKDSSQFRFVPLGGLPFQIKILVASILFLTLLSESLLKFSTLSPCTKMVTLTHIFCLNFTGKNQNISVIC